eukprot:TRINITY_DN15737_c0_g1_i1.p1 TRINITY_DN15737_c0_g1~~TRINITY_DN15737_c0_g1_i1.p1  ORF type:complete len:201 (-),score=45.11 TRINITY_DN15737_c0_g1_i1:41-643(-)
MKFRIFGNLDAPDWILKEIEVLSKMSAIKFKLLCSEIVRTLSSGNVDYEKLEKHCAGYTSSDVKAIVAAVTLIIKNSAKYNVKPEVASLELQQLGLPKLHATHIEKTLQTSTNELRVQFKQQTMKLNRIVNTEWRIDFILSSSQLKELNQPQVLLNLHTKTISSKKEPSKTKSFAFGVDQDKFRVFLHELKAARALMKDL